MTIRTTKKILFFIVGTTPTVAEQSMIDWLKDKNVPQYAFGVRSLLASTDYDGDIEPSDYVADVTGAAGTNVPAAYTSASVPVFTVPDFDENQPDKIVIGPAALSFLHTALSQMSAFKIDADGNVTDITADANMAWTSATGATATIGAGTGKLTGVAAGTTLITATYTYHSGHTIAATETVTCT